MEFATWAYPWDLLDEGIDLVATRLGDIGVDEVNLATNYHHVHAFLPHNPERRTIFARASSFFPPGEGYGRLEPVPFEGMGDTDWLAIIEKDLAATELALNSWTVGCHNSRLGLEHPETTVRTPHGDPLAFALCPSNPTVQRYLLALLRDLDSRADFRRIELESFDYVHGRAFGWHHDKFHAPLGPLGGFLLGLCFCEHCRANAADAGVDVEAARAASSEAIDALAARALDPKIGFDRWFDDHPSVRAYASVRADTLATLYAQFRSAVGADLGAYVGLVDVADTWQQGVDLESVAAHLDYVTVAAYRDSAESVLSALDAARELAPGVEYHVGLLPGLPAIEERETLVEIVDAVADAGVPRVSFYNYGLLPEHNLEWIGAATERHR